MAVIAMGDIVEVEDHVQRGNPTAQVEKAPFRKRWNDRKFKCRQAWRTIGAEWKG